MILDTTACAIAQDGAAEQMDAVAADQKSCEVTQILIRALARIVRKTRGEHGLSVIHGGTAAALAIELRAVIFVRLKIQDYRVRIGGRIRHNINRAFVGYGRQSLSVGAE